MRQSSAERAALRRRRRRTDQWRRMKVFYEEQARQSNVLFDAVCDSRLCLLHGRSFSVGEKRSKYWWDFIVNETFVLFDATHDLGAAIVDGVIPQFSGRQQSPAAITGIWSNLVRLGANPL